MYKLLLCWRYLRTRYIALVCIVSVTLGVATMIVVNSVMAGFSHEMEVRLNGMLGDLVFESRSMDGAPDADAHMARMRELAGDQIAGMSPTVQVPALMYFDVNGQLLPQQVTVVGIDERTYASVSSFGAYLQHPENRRRLSFDLREGGYDEVDHQLEDPAQAKPRPQMHDAGWRYRRYKAMIQKQQEAERRRAEELLAQAEGVASEPAAGTSDKPPQALDPFAAANRANGTTPEYEFDAARQQNVGIVVGVGLCQYRAVDGSEQYIALPGDDVNVSFPLATIPPKVTSHGFTVVDFYESKMSEYDSSFAFVPLRALQESRGMVDRTTGVGRFNTIQIKLKPGVDANVIRDRLQDAFGVKLYIVRTWQDKQGPLLAAVQMETAVLNVLLFMIIAVAGFGILAIFYMIVVEKTRDIGILKSLGASARGVMGIFLGYGLSLGLVGAGAGVAIGLTFVANINEIADLLGRLTGKPVFDPSVYYFYKIPTIVEPLTVACIAAGAIAIAVLASVLPARRAARLHPVRALRYE